MAKLADALLKEGQIQIRVLVLIRHIGGFQHPFHVECEFGKAVDGDWCGYCGRDAEKEKARPNLP